MVAVFTQVHPRGPPARLLRACACLYTCRPGRCPNSTPVVEPRTIRTREGSVIKQAAPRLERHTRVRYVLLRSTRRLGPSVRAPLGAWPQCLALQYRLRMRGCASRQCFSFGTHPLYTKLSGRDPRQANMITLIAKMWPRHKTAIFCRRTEVILIKCY
jgi:hypothetical protein